MKRLFLGLLLALVSLAVQADDFRYMAFQTNDGTIRTITADGLQLTFDDEKLTATSGDQQVIISLSELSKMYFTDTPAGIEAPVLSQNELDDNAVAYNLQGMCVGRLQAQPKGIYIVKVNGQRRKVILK